MMATQLPETRREKHKHIKKICALSCFYVQQLHKDAQTTKHKILVKLYPYTHT